MLSKVLSVFSSPDLRKKILIVAFILFVSRLLANIPIPGINISLLQSFLDNNQALGLLNIFSGGALSNLSIAMLGIGPYITATIIMQLFTVIFPGLKAIYYEQGPEGRAKFNRYSRYITVPLAALQAYGLLKLLISQNVLPPLSGEQMLVDVLIATAGSMILLWLGEIITEQKIGNGVSLLIFAGIVAGFPSLLFGAFDRFQGGELGIDTLVGFVAVAMVVITGIVFVNESERRVPVSYAKRIRGNKMYGGVSSYLPLKVNQAGVIPIIFAISVLLFPQFFGQILAAIWPTVGLAVTNWFNGIINNQVIYGALYFILVFIFTFFYTAVTFDPSEISKNLQRGGGFVPGIRPGESTAQFLKNVITRINVFGATFLGLIAVLPIATRFLTKTDALTVGGTAILIVVAVALDTAKQIDSQLTVREYENLN